MKPLPEDRRVRLAVRMDCSHEDAVIAAEFFTVFQKIIGSRFMKAVIWGAQYHRERERSRADAGAEPCYASHSDKAGAPFIVADGGEFVMCFRSEDCKLEVCDISEDFARMWIAEFPQR